MDVVRVASKVERCQESDDRDGIFQVDEKNFRLRLRLFYQLGSIASNRIVVLTGSDLQVCTFGNRLHRYNAFSSFKGRKFRLFCRSSVPTQVLSISIAGSPAGVWRAGGAHRPTRWTWRCFVLFLTLSVRQGFLYCIFGLMTVVPSILASSDFIRRFRQRWRGFHNFNIFSVILIFGSESSTRSFTFLWIDYTAGRTRSGEVRECWVKASINENDCVQRSRLRLHISCKEPFVVDSVRTH